jgi:hypothetical protein
MGPFDWQEIRADRLNSRRAGFLRPGEPADEKAGQ